MTPLPRLRGRRALITGGLGFIGSNLARRLAESGADVTVVDNLSPGQGGRLFNIRGVEDSLRVRVADAGDERVMKSLVKGQDYLFNLAGQTSHMDSMRRPEADLEANCRAQISMLEACRKRNPRVKVVFASTRQIYGKPEYLPVDEKHALRPIDVNGVNKAAGEGYHRVYAASYGLRSCCLRLTNTIGPGMRVKDARQTFLGLWVRRLLEGKPIEVWGGRQLRDINYVDDVVDAFLLAAASEKSDGQAFNVGGGGARSLEGLAKSLVRINGRGRYEVVSYPAQRKRIDIGDYYADASKIKAELGWRPRVCAEDALERTLRFYRDNLGHYL